MLLQQLHPAMFEYGCHYRDNGPSEAQAVSDDGMSGGTEGWGGGRRGGPDKKGRDGNDSTRFLI